MYFLIYFLLVEIVRHSTAVVMNGNFSLTQNGIFFLEKKENVEYYKYVLYKGKLRL